MSIFFSLRIETSSYCVLLKLVSAFMVSSFTECRVSHPILVTNNYPWHSRRFQKGSTCKGTKTRPRNNALVKSKLQHPPPLGQPTGMLLSSMPGSWEILTFRGWGGEFEPEMSSLSSGIYVFYLKIWRVHFGDFIFASEWFRSKGLQALEFHSLVNEWKVTVSEFSFF